MTNRQLEKNSAAVRKQLENHAFTGKDGEEYEASSYGDFGDYFRRKKIKLQNEDYTLRQAEPGLPHIFKGVVAHVASYTQPPPEELRRLLVIHGASHIKYLDYKTMVTHIIATTLPPKKADEWRRLRVVRPAWVVDSIAARKLLPWSDYRIIGEGPQQKRIQFSNGKIGLQEGQADQMTGYREQTKISYYTAELEKAMTAPADETSTALKDDMEFNFNSFGSYTDLFRLADEAEKVNEQRAGEEAAPNVKTTTLASPTKQTALTSEEHNALLLADPNIRKASTANPDFLNQFYSESRLHHLSTWKAELKSKLQRAAAESGGAASAKPIKRKPGARRYVMHVDFDSFFCAVSLKSAPEYVDKPAAVAHSTGNASEIASCNYPARKFGVKNGMWMKRATELCPDLKVLPYDFPAYEEASQSFYDVILGLGGIVQSVSIDEALVDVTNLVVVPAGEGTDEDNISCEQEKVEDTATKLRQQVLEKTGCNVSVGIGGNILLAKVALRRAKPAGQFQLRAEEVLGVLDGLAVEQLPGVAHSIRGKLEEIGVRLVSDLRGLSRERLATVLGPKTGERLWEQARGIDKTEVGDQPVRKSVSAEVNWGIRFVSQEEAEEFVMNLCKELERRLLKEQVRGRNLTMKILRRAADAPLNPEKHLGHGRCDVFNKSVPLGVATHSAETLGKEAVSILRSFHFSPGDLRGLGVQLQKLEPIKMAMGTGEPEGSQKKLSFGAVQRLPKRSTTVIASTQFVLPHDVDPDVLAALPADIRKRLVAEAAEGSRSNRGDRSQSNSRNQSPIKMWARMQSPVRPTPAPAPAASNPMDGLPPDIDMSVLEALPEDVRAEVLGEYRQQRKRQAESPARSPRKLSPSKASPRKASPRKGRSTVRRIDAGGAGLGQKGVKRTLWGREAAAAARERRNDAAANRVQTTFFAAQGNEPDGDANVPLLEKPDPAVLAALPEDIRAEVLADYERRQLEHEQEMATFGLLRMEAPGAARRPERKEAEGHSGEKAQTMLQFPSPPPKAILRAAISPSASHALSLEETKNMLRAWHEATAEDGPHESDVAVLERFLKEVVTEERDMEKARKVIVWLEWQVGEAKSGLGRQGWELAVAQVKEALQEAMAVRGLGPMHF